MKCSAVIRVPHSLSATYPCTRTGSLYEDGRLWCWQHAPSRREARGKQRHEYITTAAIRVDGEVWTLPRPARHHVLVQAWCLAHFKDGERASLHGEEQGFLTNRGRFVDRTEAARLAYAAGQTKRRETFLYSEDLW